MLGKLTVKAGVYLNPNEVLILFFHRSRHMSVPRISPPPVADTRANKGKTSSTPTALLASARTSDSSHIGLFDTAKARIEEK